jgi:hypothetical protein
MNESSEYIIDLFALSGGFWLLFAFYTSFRIRRFIVKRYEQETDLLNTVFFKEHASFTRYLPNFFSSVTYTTHLLMCIWGWWLYSKRKVFRDVQDPNLVIQHFSPKEIRRVKQFAINGAILVAHGIAFFVFRSIWPKEFIG